MPAPQSAPADNQPPQPAGKRRRLRRRVLALLLGVVLSLLLGEGVLRIYVAARGWTANCYASRVLLFQSHPQSGYELTPDFYMKSGALELAVNSHGLRGAEVATEKPKGTRRIAVLGGSSAFGYFMSEGHYASALLEKKLRDAGDKVEVLNAAVPGYDLEQVTVRYTERVRPLSPDVVVLYLGWNDLRNIVSETDPPDESSPAAGSGERLLAHSTLYGLLRYRLFTPPPAFVPPPDYAVKPTPAGTARFEQRLEELARMIRETPAKLVVCSQAMAAHPDAPADLRTELAADPARQKELIEFGEFLHKTLRNFAARHNAPFVDAWAEIPPSYDTLGDGIHLTAAGEKQLANLLFDAVQPLVESEADPPAGKD